MSKAIDTIERTHEYTQFIDELNDFHARKGTTLQAEPILGGQKLDLFRIYKAVMDAGGFDQVTKKRSWKHIGDAFDFPKTCTNSAYILKGVYIRNLLGWEEETVWGKAWNPPDELRGPNAHRASTLAGKSFKNKGQSFNKSNSSYSNKSPRSTPTPNYTPIQPDTTHARFDMLDLGLSLPDSSSIFHFDQLAIRNELDQCTISEFHHQSHPHEHVHMMKEQRTDCIRANNFDEQVKQRILYSLQSSNEWDVEWALNYVVTISFERPEELRLDKTPLLLDLLLKWSNPFLNENTNNNNNTTIIKNNPNPILKILHILRNFSFLEVNARILASDIRLKSMIEKCLALSTSKNLDLGRHCIDVLENMAPYIQLNGPFDDCIACLNNLLYIQERYLLIGTLRILTTLAMTDSNQVCLISVSMATAIRIAQLLVINNDEELVGTVLEYLYQYTRISADFRRQLLMAHSGADIGVLVSLLSTKSKYFRTKLCDEGNTSNMSSPASSADMDHQHEPHGSVPCVPNLTAYQQLDEPYRCLGWLKDKFEVSNTDSVLSLDDMYMLYEMRFGQEKALKMKEFYTVLKIAFPGAPDYMNGSGPILEGTSVRGIQIKMSILEDGAEMLCQWTNCSQTFGDELLLQRHVIRDHVGMHQHDMTELGEETPAATSETGETGTGGAGEMLECMWTDCADSMQEFKDRGEITTHLRSHFDEEQQQQYQQLHNNNSNNHQYQHNSYMMNMSNSNGHNNMIIDYSDIKGIALVAANLLRQLSKDPESHDYFKPYEQELLALARRRPRLGPHIKYIFSKF
ncbi:hypothetical protein BDC45DRAFT_519638 [Circinella umbellata]|nr:hypothetical protein BDC45DRAFT_519638 [Circinella umbellata]